MNLTGNKIVDKFIEEFENKFSNYLGVPTQMVPHPNKPEPVYSDYISVCPPSNPNYSDWDLGCNGKPDIPKDVISEMESFIRSYPLLSLQGQLLTTLDVHKIPRPIFHHINAISWLHFMAFLPKDKTAPFFDFHVVVPNEKLKELYSGISANEFIKWIMVTCWRKLLKDGSLPYYKNWLLPILSPQEQKDFLTNPKKFIPFYLKSKGSKDYTDLIDYLELEK
jgi:hypothetical protein